MNLSHEVYHTCPLKKNYFLANPIFEKELKARFFEDQLLQRLIISYMYILLRIEPRLNAINQTEKREKERETTTTRAGMYSMYKKAYDISYNTMFRVLFIRACESSIIRQIGLAARCLTVSGSSHTRYIIALHTFSFTVLANRPAILFSRRRRYLLATVIHAARLSPVVSPLHAGIQAIPPESRSRFVNK